eukprot:m.222650 g.222650  ORF g.222650 m.222650 type:complete len:365 (-) comp54178_c0_seq8:112-1206(-)
MLLFAALVCASSALAAIPAGFATYFTGDTCPTGWYPVVDAAGRLIASVTEPSFGGLLVNEPLADQEIREHSHNFTSLVSLTAHHLAGIENCCNDQGALAGRHSGSGVSASGASDLPFTQLLLCSVQDTAAYYTLPAGIVGYFTSNTTACPSGWNEYLASNGRFIIPGYDQSQAIASKSLPLGNLEDRTHTHTFTSQINTGSVSYVGVDGCCNDYPSSDGTYPVSGQALSASTGLPYIQLLTCISTGFSTKITMPTNAYLMQTDDQCPQGWELVTDISGRFIVALPEDGTAGASFGGASIDQGGDQPVHNHTVSGSISLPNTSVELASGCCASGYAEAGNVEFSAVTVADPTNLPFLMLPMCQLS